MAGKDRAQAHDLILRYLETQDLKRAGLFPVLRQLEARAADLPRLGRARLPADSIVDLAQEPISGFAASTLTDARRKRGRVELRGHWLGLTGPMGPLPVHLTEFAQLEKRYAKQHPFGDWLDFLANRMLQYFYRAWAESQPAAHADRGDPADNAFADWIAALTGFREGASPGALFDRRARYHYAPVFAGRRSASALEGGLSDLLRQPVRVEEYAPKWRHLEPEDRSRLGRDYATLGSDTVLGGRVFSASDAFTVTVRAKSYDDYLTLLPGGARFEIAGEAIEAFKPTHLEWELTVEIEEEQAPPVRLGSRSRMGWDSWMKRPARKGASETERKRQSGGGAIRADAHLRVSNMKRRKVA